MPDIEALKSDKQLNEFSQVTYKVECDIIRCRGVSMLYEYLLDTFGTNESIFVSDIKYETYSRPWIDKQLSKLCRAKKSSGMKEEFCKHHFTQTLTCKNKTYVNIFQNLPTTFM